MLIRDNTDEFLGLVGETAEDTGIPQTLVEKDYWITELLRSIAIPIENATPIFKGGTSLSKVYRLVHRFSVDLDILVRFAPGMGKGRRDRILRLICGRVTDDLGLNVGETASDTGNRRTVEFLYPVLRPTTLGIRPGVTLEARSLPPDETMPTASRIVRSYMAEYALERGATEGDFDEFTAFEIEVLNPERTLVEKIAMLHDTATRYPNVQPRVIQAAGRHLYDVVQMIRDDEIRRSLEPAPQTVSAMAEQIVRISESLGFSSTPRPDAGYATSPAFDLESPSHEALRPAYEDVLRTLVYGPGPHLSYDECLITVRGYSNLL